MHMRDFWNARAVEDPYYFIDNRRRYRDPDLAEFWAGGERDLDAIFELLDVHLERSDVALDIGCGVGRLTRVLAGRAARVYGLDVSGEMIERAREHNAALANADWIVGDGVSLRPLGDASITVVVSHVVFQHIPDPQITLGYVREIGRVLQPGGWSAFQVSNDPGLHRAPSGALARLRGLGRARPRGQSDPAWVGSAIDLHELRAAAAEGGLEVERIAGEGTQFCMVLARRVGSGPTS